MNKKPTPFPNFNPAAALRISSGDEAEFKITVNMKTGAMVMTTTRPDVHHLAVIDILAAQQQTICRAGLVQYAQGTPGFGPVKLYGDTEENTEKNSDENGGTNGNAS
jgi:hypothetical protein